MLPISAFVSVYVVLRRLTANTLLAVAALAVAAALAELALRTFPVLIPKGAYGAGRYDPELGLNLAVGVLVLAHQGSRRIVAVRGAPHTAWWRCGSTLVRLV